MYRYPDAARDADGVCGASVRRSGRAEAKSRSRAITRRRVRDWHASAALRGAVRDRARRRCRSPTSWPRSWLRRSASCAVAAREPLEPPQWPTAHGAARRAARQGADRARARVSAAARGRSGALRGAHDRRRRQRARWPLLRRAARQAVARATRCTRSPSERPLAGDVRRVHRDVAGEGGRGARRDCSTSSRSCATSPCQRRRARARAAATLLGTHAIRQQSGGAVLGDMVDAWMFGALAELDEVVACYRAASRATHPGARADASNRRAS